MMFARQVTGFESTRRLWYSTAVAALAATEKKTAMTANPNLQLKERWQQNRKRRDSTH